MTSNIIKLPLATGHPIFVNAKAEASAYGFEAIHERLSASKGIVRHVLYLLQLRIARVKQLIDQIEDSEGRARLLMQLKLIEQLVDKARCKATDL
jgi:hypothetical protein